MSRPIRIGTRESRLAKWQANQVQQGLEAEGHSISIIPVKSEGDLDLTTPLYETGVQGFFTRSLDAALLDKRIDIAVHSYKDVPVTLAKGLCVAAVPKRGNPFDMFVARDEQTMKEVSASKQPLIIATSSIRRKAQWLHRHRNSQIENIRGNVQTRLQKLSSSSWHGAIFAAAGLERLGITENETGPQLLLDWMLPAPAQGAIVVVCREDDREMLNACSVLHDENTALCTYAEREFLRLLQGGCSTPISALATMDENEFHFKGNITTTDGNESIAVSIHGRHEDYLSIVQQAVDNITSSFTVQQLLS
jgi:hydroxymethylbilane synthase